MKLYKLTTLLIAMLLIFNTQFTHSAQMHQAEYVVQSSDPGSGDDALDGFSTGSIWINTSDSTVWRCMDNSVGSAVWVETTGGDVTKVGDGESGDIFTPDGEGNELYFEGSVSDANETLLQGNDVGSDITLTLPDSEGSSGQLLSTDGSGVMSWVTDDTGTDDQNISGSGFTANTLTIGIENGTEETVDLSALDDTGTDDQNISGSGFTANTLTIGIENGTNETVDLSALDDAGTDDQNITGSSLTGEDLIIGIENGTSETVSFTGWDTDASDDFSGSWNDLSDIPPGFDDDVDDTGTDDQTASEVSTDTVNFDNHLSGTDTDVQTALDTIDDMTAGSGGGLSWQLISSNTTASSGNGYLVDASSSNITLTLPGSPSEGDQVGIADIYNSATTNTISIDNNGSNIEGVNSNYVIGSDGIGFTLVYSDSTRGWEKVNISSAGSANYTISFTCPSDPEGDDISVELQIDNDKDFSSPEVSAVSHSDETNWYLFDGSDWEPLSDMTGTGIIASGYQGNRVGYDASGQATSGSIYFARFRISDDGGSTWGDWNGEMKPGMVTGEGGGTDDQNISGSGFTANTLTIGIENGTEETVDLSALDDTGTDNQNITSVSFDGQTMTVNIENGTSASGDITELTGMKTVEFQGEYDNGTVSSNTTIDWSNGQTQKITLGSDITISFSNMGVGHYQLKVVQDATGSRTPTLPSGKWPGGTLGSFSTNSGAEDVLSIYYDGSSYYYQLNTGFAVP